MNESGKSSFELLQNAYIPGQKKEQPIAIALALSEQILNGRGVCRVHGGGFAGTIQAYVLVNLLEEYRLNMEAVFGAGSCHVLTIRDLGPVCMLSN